MITYDVRRNVDEYELVSIVPVPEQPLPFGGIWGGGNAVNYVCGGTKDYCEGIKRKLEAMRDGRD